MSSFSGVLHYHGSVFLWGTSVTCTTQSLCSPDLVATLDFQLYIWRGVHSQKGMYSETCVKRPYKTRHVLP